MDINTKKNSFRNNQVIMQVNRKRRKQISQKKTKEINTT